MEGVYQLVADVVFGLLFVGAISFIFMGEHKGARVIGGVGALVALIALLASLSVIIVPAGNVGVVTAFGAVQNETLPPGMHFRMPFVNQAHMITTRVQPHEFKEINAASAEYQTVKLTGVMNYHIDGMFASDLYQRVGDDFAAKILDPAFNDYIKTVVPTYKIGDILAKRDEIRSRAKNDLQANLSQYHIIVDDIYIANIGFSPEYEAAIESKQVAQQQVQTQIEITRQKEEQKKQARIDAEGQADATRALAQGQADANNLLTKSLSPELIQYTLINKLAPTIQTMLLPSGQNFILDPNALLTPKQ
jgi:regulator of protease activity HflC (stomatin/prohibitin superfamily)